MLVYQKSSRRCDSISALEKKVTATRAQMEAIILMDYMSSDIEMEIEETTDTKDKDSGASNHLVCRQNEWRSAKVSYSA